MNLRVFSRQFAHNNVMSGMANGHTMVNSNARKNTHSGNSYTHTDFVQTASHGGFHHTQSDQLADYQQQSKFNNAYS